MPSPQANNEAALKASGVIYRAGAKVLLIKRVSDDEHNDCWELPGGHVEADEDHTAAAIRESFEEIGFTPDRAALRPFNYKDNGAVKYLTFVHRGEEFEPALNHEHSAHIWADAEMPPAPLHPGTAVDLKKLTAPVVTETDIANQMREGTLSGPQHFDNMWLFAIRITGTGTSYRSKDDQFTYRRPENYLTPEFLARCNGLSVIWMHPEKNTLSSKEFADRVIGTILLPYLKADEVWGIARIYDEEAVVMMLERQLSTSPAVVFHNIEVNDTIALNDGTLLLIEGKPSLLDHVAICELGVWDKGGDPSGIISDPMENAEMPDQIDTTADDAAKADAAKKIDPALTLLKEISTKLDSQGATLVKQDAAIADLQKRIAKADDDGGKSGGEIALADADKEETAEEKAAREEKEKADAEEKDRIKADAEDMKARMGEIEKKIPKADTDEDYQEMADSQAKADSVANAFGQRAPGPLLGESPLNYRKRLLGGFKPHAKQFKDIDLATINDSALLGVVEKSIYADAMDAAMNPTAATGGGLREIKRTDGSGRQISTFVGDTGEWMRPFQSASRPVYGWNKGV